MSNDEAMLGDAARIDDQVADLPMHLFHNGTDDLRVVSSAIQIALVGMRIKEFNVREINIDNAIEQLDRLKELVPATIVHQRLPKALFDRIGKGCDQLRYVMSRGDEIDVVA